MAATGSEPAHDKIVFPVGVMDVFPDKHALQKIVFRSQDGVRVDETCAEKRCASLLVRIAGTSDVPDGTYQVLPIGTQNVLMLRSVPGDHVAGYIARNRDGDSKFFSNLEYAETYENSGAELKKALIIGALVAVTVGLIVGAAILAGNSNGNDCYNYCYSCY